MKSMMITVIDLYIDEYYFAMRQVRESEPEDGEFYGQIADDALFHMPKDVAREVVQTEANTAAA